MLRGLGARNRGVESPDYRDLSLESFQEQAETLIFYSECEDPKNTFLNIQ